jgi:hypothetical protein
MVSKDLSVINLVFPLKFEQHDIRELYCYYNIIREQYCYFKKITCCTMMLFLIVICLFIVVVQTSSI